MGSSYYFAIHKLMKFYSLGLGGGKDKVIRDFWLAILDNSVLFDIPIEDLYLYKFLEVFLKVRFFAS